MSEDTQFDPTPDDNDTTDPSPAETEPAAPEVTYAPTIVNPQAHEPIQAGERAQVGQTVDTSQH